MFIERFLQFAICLIVILSATLLGIGQEDPFLPVMVCVFTCISLLVTDIYQIFSLNKIFQNIVTILAMIIAVGNVSFRHQIIGQIIAIANLLVYLEIIILFRKKDIHTYWQLILLSFLQVVVAAAFPQSVTFGLLLLLYLLLVLISISLLIMTKRHEEMFHISSVTNFSETVPQNINQIKKFREYEKKQFLHMSWLRQVFSVGLKSIFIGILAFFLVPRTGISLFHGIRETGPSITGFSDSIKLGEMGEILQNRNEMMRVKFSTLDLSGISPESLPLRDYRDIPRKALSIKDLPASIYLRGTILNEYSQKTWSLSPYMAEQNDNPSFIGQKKLFERWKYFWDERFPDYSRKSYELSKIHTPPAFMLPFLTVVEYSFEPFNLKDLHHGKAQLFAVYPFYGMTAGVNTRTHYDSTQKTLKWNAPAYLPHYTLLTPAISFREQMTIIPEMEPVFISDYLQLPEKLDENGEKVSAVPTLIARAQQWRDSLNVPGIEYNAYDVATHFMRQLQNTEHFHYTLRRPSGDPALDPLEDFIKNHPEGHCEYFASVLALMLRSQGIPSRIVLGFHSNDTFSAGDDFFIVRHSDAHAWVEAWLSPDEIPEYLKNTSPWDKDAWEYGAWLRLDPTPEMEERLGALSQIAEYCSSILDWTEFLWKTYIIRMDSPRQKETVYDPIKNLGNSIWKNMVKSQWKKNFHDFQKNMLQLWKDGTLTKFIIGTLLFIIILRWLCIKLRKRTQKKLFLEREEGMIRNKILQKLFFRKKNSVDFYLRFEEILRKKGITRSAYQTSQEMIGTVETIFPRETVTPIIDAYYAIRFGQKTPDEKTLQELRHHVEELSK
ncbi:MAG: DUF3488 and transglutaminase-like domain-containing protein [Planctomycetia bacterium]|nr:DUF3488 and transglutaminase-like domain-containing protein [Planctomycetia bacterium]